MRGLSPNNALQPTATPSLRYGSASAEFGRLAKKMSQQKLLLHVMAAIAFLLGVAMLLAGRFAHFGFVDVEAVQLAILAAVPVTFMVWLVAILLVVEFARAARAGQSWLRRARGVSTPELRILVQWCPRWLLTSSMLLAAISIAVSVSGGKVSWVFGEPLSRVAALGLCAVSAAFNLLAAPVVASASRMPGRFDAQQAIQADGASLRRLT